MTGSGGVRLLSVPFLSPLGPCFFLSCPVSVAEFRPWFIDLWNHSIIPYLQEGAKDGIKVSTAHQSVKQVLKKLLIIYFIHMLSKFLSGSWSEGCLGGPGGVGERDPSLAQCPTRPIKALSSTSPKRRSTE